MNVKVNYNSRVESEEESSPPKASRCPKSSGGSSSQPARRKKADLYAACSLQTLPKEMVVSPALLDFLEQALETLPFISMQGKAPKGGTRSCDFLLCVFTALRSTNSLPQPRPPLTSPNPSL